MTSNFVMTTGNIKEPKKGGKKELKAKVVELEAQLKALKEHSTHEHYCAVLDDTSSIVCTCERKGDPDIEPYD